MAPTKLACNCQRLCGPRESSRSYKSTRSTPKVSIPPSQTFSVFPSLTTFSVFFGFLVLAARLLLAPQLSLSYPFYDRSFSFCFHHEDYFYIPASHRRSLCLCTRFPGYSHNRQPIIHWERPKRYYQPQYHSSSQHSRPQQRRDEPCFDLWSECHQRSAHRECQSGRCSYIQLERCRSERRTCIFPFSIPIFSY